MGTEVPVGHTLKPSDQSSTVKKLCTAFLQVSPRYLLASFLHSSHIPTRKFLIHFPRETNTKAAWTPVTQISSEIRALMTELITYNVLFPKLPSRKYYSPWRTAQPSAVLCSALLHTPSAYFCHYLHFIENESENRNTIFPEVQSKRVKAKNRSKELLLQVSHKAALSLSW